MWRSCAVTKEGRGRFRGHILHPKKFSAWTDCFAPKTAQQFATVHYHYSHFLWNIPPKNVPAVTQHTGTWKDFNSFATDGQKFISSHFLCCSSCTEEVKSKQYSVIFLQKSISSLIFEIILCPCFFSEYKYEMHFESPYKNSETRCLFIYLCSYTGAIICTIVYHYYCMFGLY